MVAALETNAVSGESGLAVAVPVPEGNAEGITVTGCGVVTAVEGGSAVLVVGGEGITETG